MFHSEILASLNFNKIKFFHLDWRTTIQWNVVLAIFQHNKICQDCCKITRSTFECMVILKSRGQDPQTYGELQDKSVPYFQQEYGPCPLDWRKTIHWNVDLVFFQQPWHYDYVAKLPEQHFSVWLFSNPGDNILFLLKFNEARISEWNIYQTLSIWLGIQFRQRYSLIKDWRPTFFLNIFGLSWPWDRRGPGTYSRFV